MKRLRTPEFLVLVGFVLVLLVGGGLILHFTGGDAPEPSPVKTAAPTPSATTLSDMHEETETHVCDKQAEPLRNKTKAFVTAWYDLRPDDKTSSRKTRLLPFVNGEEFFELHPVDIDPGDPVEQDRIAEGSSYGATLENPEPEVFCVSDYELEAATSALVQVWEESASGVRNTEPLRLTLSITWVFVDDNALVTSIEERWLP